LVIRKFTFSFYVSLKNTKKRAEDTLFSSFCNATDLTKPVKLRAYIDYSCRSSNGFGDTRFWFCRNL